MSVTYTRGSQWQQHFDLWLFFVFFTFHELHLPRVFETLGLHSVVTFVCTFCKIMLEASMKMWTFCQWKMSKETREGKGKTFGSTSLPDELLGKHLISSFIAQTHSSFPLPVVGTLYLHRYSSSLTFLISNKTPENKFNGLFSGVVNNVLRLSSCLKRSSDEEDTE